MRERPLAAKAGRGPDGLRTEFEQSAFAYNLEALRMRGITSTAVDKLESDVSPDPLCQFPTNCAIADEVYMALRTPRLPYCLLG